VKSLRGLRAQSLRFINRTTNLIPDIVNCELPLDNRRSPGYRRVEPAMGGNRFYLWIGQHESGRYSKAHKHASAAVLICVKSRSAWFQPRP
jgi:hypothetical protein